MASSNTSTNTPRTLLKTCIVGACALAMTACSSIASVVLPAQSLPPAKVVKAQDSLNPNTLPQLHIVENGGDKTSKRYLGIAEATGENAFNDLLHGFVKQQWQQRDQLDSAAPAKQEGSKPASGEATKTDTASNTSPAGRSLQVNWSIPLAQGPVLAEQLDSTWWQGEQKLQQHSAVFYTLTDSHSAHRSLDLFAPKQHEAIKKALTHALAKSRVLEGSESLPADTSGDEKATKLANKAASSAASEAALNAAVLDKSGGFSLIVTPGSLITSATPIWVQFPAKLAAGFYSKLGSELSAKFKEAQTPLQLTAASTAKTKAELVPQSFVEPLDCTKEKCVALTFDDGPGPYTEKLLQELRAENVHATFFVTGIGMTKYPDLIAKELADGHAIGDHTWNHPNLDKLTAAEVKQELTRTANKVTELSGATKYRVKMLRPPYGNSNETVAKVTKELGMSIIIWDVDTEDWKNKDSKKTTELLFKALRPGSIVLMHDVHPSTVEAVPAILTKLKSMGYKMVTVPQLMAGKLQPGVRHCAAYAIGKKCRAW